MTVCEVLWGCFCRKPPRYVLYKCSYVQFNGTFGASNQRSDARRVRWHPADVNPEVAVTLLRGEVTTSARHEVLYSKDIAGGICAMILDHTDRN
jgi:hypothetical protein